MAEVVKGLVRTLKALDALGKDLEPKIGQIVEANAREMEQKAKSFAPIDTGKLRQSIKAYPLDQLTWRVAANATGLAPYAAYMEFGTGGLVDIPAEMAEEAAKFRGRGIKQVNIRPRPYLYPAFMQQRTQYLADLEDLLDQETKKI